MYTTIKAIIWRILHMVLRLFRVSKEPPIHKRKQESWEEIRGILKPLPSDKALILRWQNHATYMFVGTHALSTLELDIMNIFSSYKDLLEIVLILLETSHQTRVNLLMLKYLSHLLVAYWKHKSDMALQLANSELQLQEIVDNSRMFAIYIGNLQHYLIKLENCY